MVNKELIFSQTWTQTNSINYKDQLAQQDIPHLILATTCILLSISMALKYPNSKVGSLFSGALLAICVYLQRNQLILQDKVVRGCQLTDNGDICDERSILYQLTVDAVLAFISYLYVKHLLCPGLAEKHSKKSLVKAPKARLTYTTLSI